MDRQKAAAVLLVGLCFFVVGIFVALREQHTPGVLTVTFFDVGQGDAIFIEGPTGQQILIDGGRDRTVLQTISKEMGFFDRTIDVVVATHPDLDHIGGLPDMFDRYRIATVVESGNENGEAPLAALRTKMTEEKSEIITARRGQIIDLGGGAYIKVLFPDRDVSHIESNDASVVLQLVYGETEFLLTGDAPQSIETYLLLQYGDALQSDVLKVGHHGSRTSSNAFFVGTVAPEYAVVSAGCDNSYGHPHEEVVTLFTELEIELLETCTLGNVSFVSDGVSVARR